jgi:DnaJ family protein C protein 25
MIQEISIEGGYSMPTYKDILIYRIIVFPITISTKIYKWVRWIYKYKIKNEEYTEDDQNLLTM